MIRAIVHQGFLGNAIEYFAVIAGPDIDRRFFFEQIGDDVRYFGGNAEIVLNAGGVRFHGNGGIFGEYMFGGHLPVGDLLNEEVVNRLVLFGATTDPDLRFTANTQGSESYDNLFLHGNAVANYLFFLDDRRRIPDVADRQEQTLKTAGRLLKRSRKVGAGNFLSLAHELLGALDEPQTTIVLVRIVHRSNQRLYEVCRDAYAHNRSLEDDSNSVPDADEHGRIEPYQRERIQIDVIYHHPAHREIIDEYKRVLASCAGSLIGPSPRARLMRLRTLALRNEIPPAIFDTLEEIVLQDRPTVAKADEPEYISGTREILVGLLLGRNLTRKLSPLDLVTLMENKQKAAANRDQTFEEVLLETGRLIDEIGREEEDFERLESFGELVTFFDRIDHTTTLVNRLAFMDDIELSPEQVRSLMGNMQVFEALRRGLFQSLFIDPIVSNEYALAYGKKKLYALTLGLLAMQNAEASVADVAESIRDINRSERAYFAVYRLARRRMSNFYLELNTAEGRETFRREIRAETAHDTELHDLQELITDSLLEDVITKIRLEAFYINQLLPRIVDEHDTRLRNDFLSNSGLDRFQVEELEGEYFQLRSLPPQLLEAIR